MPHWLKSPNLIYLAVSVAAGALCYALAGPQAFALASDSGASLIGQIIVLLLGAILVGSYFQVLVPHEVITRWLGGESGMRGLALASAVGAITPGGPFTSFPLAFALYKAGADLGTTVAFITAWSILNVSRLFVWDLPLLGVELSLVRLFVSLPLPIIAGLLARLIAARFAPRILNAEP